MLTHSAAAVSVKIIAQSSAAPSPHPTVHRATQSPAPVAAVTSAPTKTATMTRTPSAPATSTAGTNAGSGGSTSPGTTVLIAAIVTAIATLLVALITQLETARRERNTRRYERVRDGLHAAQDSCSKLRTRLRAYGILLRRDQGAFTDEVVTAQQRFDVALQKVSVAIKLIDPLAAEAVRGWIDDAQVRFVSAAEVSESAEEEKWDAVVTILGAALNDPQGVVRPLAEVREREREARAEREKAATDAEAKVKKKAARSAGAAKGED